MSHTFVFFGIVGSGKGTQVKLLMDFLKEKDGVDCVYVSPGHEYRRLAENNDFTGSLIKGPLLRGELLPGVMTDAIVTNIFMNSLDDKKNLIMDGYPRAVSQAISFESMMKFYKRDNVKIIYIELSKEESVKRLQLRSRPDDTKEGIETRFREYEENVLPAMNYFKDKYEIFHIKGEQSIEDVHKDILKALGF